MVFGDDDEDEARMSRLTTGLSDLQDKLRQQTKPRTWRNFFKGGKSSRSMRALFFAPDAIPVYESVYLRLTNDLTVSPGCHLFAAFSRKVPIQSGLALKCKDVRMHCVPM